ncbi:MAG: hypothetical protein FWG08_05635 [Propionibacteriaceae bacterium]|nr:hypothetical protein [Propionibacteriaceae bacterium]
MRFRGALIALVASVCLAGCGAQDWKQQSPIVEVTYPDEGQSVEQWEVNNPATLEIWLPDHITLTYTAHQENLLIIVGIIDEAEVVEEYLQSSLPGLGWTITAQGAGGLMFDYGDWQGGFAVGNTSWALTVRND